MHIDPLATALKEISETQDLVESLLHSSESFDYPRTKLALKELSDKVRDLARIRAAFEEIQKTRQPNIYVVDFKAQPPPETRPPGPN